MGQCGHFEPGISSFTLWLCPLLSTTSALTVHQQCPLFTLCTQLTLSSTPIHPAPTPHFGPHINNNNCNYNIPEVVTPVEGLKSPIFALMTAQIRLFSYRNCGIHTSYMQPSIIVQNKFSLLWGEAQLCLPYDCLLEVSIFCSASNC